MPTVCLNQSNLEVRLNSERLEIREAAESGEPKKLLREIPLRDIDRVIASESVRFSGRATAALLERGIPIHFFSWQGRFLGNFLPAQNHHGLSRIKQYQKTLDPDFGLLLSRRIISGKLYNQRRVIQRLAASRGLLAASGLSVETDQPLPPDASHATSVKADLTWLDTVFACLGTSATIDELRGHEGAATARYFGGWSRFLPPGFPFDRRSTRPPLNPVNACISFGATIIYNEMVAFCHARGLDPALGLLHTTQNGRWSLALDLIEPFRPAIVEALALDLFSHQILNQSHFEDRDGGVFLNEEGRRKFFLQYERRMERQFMSEAAGHRTTLRQQLEQQAVMYKTALENEQNFEPFLMN